MDRREFTNAQNALDAARRAEAEARSESFLLGERLRKHRRHIREVSRRADDLDRLTEEERLMVGEIETRRAAEVGALTELLDRQRLFERFTNPIDNIGLLDDRYPIVLFPVRLETRFKDLTSDGSAGTQLWLRIYPDDILVDTFESVLAEVEISNARVYWTNVWKAGGDDGEKRAAWQSLVKSHGAGRAFWIIQQVAPTNLDDEPVKGAGEHLLVVVTETPLPGSEKAPAEDYWRRVFEGSGDEAALNAALQDLVSAVGPARAETIRSEYAPQNIAAPIANPESVTSVRVEFLELPALDTIPSQEQPWMHPARAWLLPDRFVVLGFNGEEQTLLHIGSPVPSELMIGPNPASPDDDQLRLEDDELVLPEGMRWINDFDEAVAKGMGFRIDLDPIQARRGFDRLFVLGIRLSSDQDRGRQNLETLVQNHQRSRKGFSLLPQGAPTNNVEDDGAGYSWREDADVSYEHFFGGESIDDPIDWRRRRDGRWLAHVLGIDPEILKASPNYYATDQCEARALNEALWPTTLGYFMERMMEPVFSDDTVEDTRAYFNRFVLGRGTIPSIRVGRQPYGILPAAPYSRLTWLRRGIRIRDEGVGDLPRRQLEFLPRLYELILRAHEDWKTLAGEVSYVGKPGVDPHQALLDVVGLHPTSVEYYQRYAESAEMLYNRLKLGGPLGAFVAALIAAGYVESGLQLLTRLGYVRGDDDETPEILSKFFLRSPNLLKGPVIDDQPLSETASIRAYREDGSNYLSWLIEAARDSHDTLRMQAGFLDGRPPTALLYLMLRHALDLGFVETSIQLHLEANLLTASEALEARRDPKFFQIEDVAEDKGSAWKFLYAKEQSITQSPDLRVAEFIPRILTTRDPYLNKQLEALEHLERAPTARLERAFAEHIDCCTYRLDAWWLSLLGAQIDVMRATARGSDDDSPGRDDAGRPNPEEPDDSQPTEDAVAMAGGCYLGAFGWLEDLRPDHRKLEPVRLPEHLDAVFNKESDETPLTVDDQNFGYIHAPSLNHAVTAAVLRNGYLANATPTNPETLSVNLTSQRVRLALGVVQGMRNGQSLGALLGYQLERGLHNREGLFLDSIIFELRKKFPLAANQLASTREPDAAIESIEARNVVDGAELLEHTQSTGSASYPFGFSDLPAVADPAARSAIDAEVRKIADINDAVADLALAESVYQVVQGNYDRAGAALDAYGKGEFPPIPEVVQTPRSGVTLTHRVGLHLPANLDPDDAAFSTPRAKGEPAISLWIEQLLPSPSSIFCSAEFVDASTGLPTSVSVSAAELGLHAVDLLYLVHGDAEQAMTALDDRVIWLVSARPDVRPDAEIKIRYRTKPATGFSFFEISPLVDELRALLLRSRPLRATDARLPNEASKAEESAAAIREVKVTRVRDLLVTQAALLATLVGDADTLLSDPDESVVEANAVDNIDALILRFGDIANAVGLFGLPGTGLGFAWDWRKKEFADLLSKLEALLQRWESRLAKFDGQLVEYGALDPSTADEERIAFLLQAALSIHAEPLAPPPSGDPADLLSSLNGVVRPAFVGVRNSLSALIGSEDTVGGLYKALVAAETPIAVHDLEPLDLEPNLKSIVAFAKTLHSSMRALSNDVGARIAAAAALLASTDAGSADARIDELTRAVRQLTSEDFVVLPEFSAANEHGTEWRKTLDDTAQLTAFLRDDAGVDFPVDDWLYGVARVREKLQHFESATMLAEALTGSSLDLVPAQFPYRENDSWLALRFPEQQPGGDSPFVIDEDKLLYTAYYHSPFNPGDPRHCGVLVDEWTEVIPTNEETTGLAFHYDRPNSEPPQTLLLALPASFSGGWKWADLVDTLHETLDMARLRAVEPGQLDETAYGRFLPAVLSKVTRYPIMAMLDLAHNNAVQFLSEKVADT